MRFCQILLVVIFSLQGCPTAADAQESVAQDVGAVSKVCDEFELARRQLNIASARRLVMADAPAFYADGKLPRPLVDRLQSQASGKRKETASDLERVLFREIKIRDNVATVTELLGAVAPIPAGSKVVPRRRSIVWRRQADDWKIVSLHASHYSVWEKAITAFESVPASDIPEGGIVFVGSSSIRGWKTLGEDFADLPTIRRGFGGSQLIDSIMYAHRIVLPYKPRSVAVYAGDNDIAFGKSPKEVFDDFKTLVETIHAGDERIRIGFIAIKPSIKRWDMWKEMVRANALIAEFAKSNPKVTYLDIATPMLGELGKPRPELFAKDGLHLSRRGYEIWTSAVRPWAKQN